MLMRFLGLGIASLGLGMVLHNLIRMSPIFVPFSLVIMLIVIVVIGALILVSFLMSNQLMDKGFSPEFFVIASVISLIMLLIGTVIAWVN